MRDRRLEQLPKPPGRSLMSVRGNAAPRGMTAHDRIRLTGPFAELHTKTAPVGSTPAGADHFQWLVEPVSEAVQGRKAACGCRGECYGHTPYKRLTTWGGGRAHPRPVEHELTLRA